MDAIMSVLSANIVTRDDMADDARCVEVDV